MPQIRIECKLPFMLALDDGEYPDGRSEPLHWAEMVSRPADESGGTRIWRHFESTETTEPQIKAQKSGEARSLIRRLNRLIRWYRVVSTDRAVAEVTMWKASPFRFFLANTVEPWGDPLEVESPPPVSSAFYTYAAQFDQLSQKVRENFASGWEPPVDSLFLLDARQALDEGRFREAVLFSWSTIDATFTSRFDGLVDTVLADEWSKGRDFLKGIDFGLRHRMTIGMRLVTGKSFFNEDGDLWQRLSKSYDCRNAIIHRGQTASEADAEDAVCIAQDVVNLMKPFTPETEASS